MNRIILLLTCLLTACSSHSDTSVLPVEIYNHTSKAINFNMTDATKKDWKGWELGYGGGGYGVSAYDSTSGSGWRVPKCHRVTCTERVWQTWLPLSLDKQLRLRTEERKLIKGKARKAIEIRLSLH